MSCWWRHDFSPRVYPAIRHVGRIKQIQHAHKNARTTIAMMNLFFSPEGGLYFLSIYNEPVKLMYGLPSKST